jgi:hypothetical protein
MIAVTAYDKFRYLATNQLVTIALVQLVEPLKVLLNHTILCQEPNQHHAFSSPDTGLISSQSSRLAHLVTVYVGDDYNLQGGSTRLNHVSNVELALAVHGFSVDLQHIPMSVCIEVSAIRISSSTQALMVEKTLDWKRDSVRT